MWMNTELLPCLSISFAVSSSYGMQRYCALRDLTLGRQISVAMKPNPPAEHLFACM